MNTIWFWVLVPYDALVALPYFWAKVALGIGTGLLIPGRIVGLVACALGNAAIFAYMAFAAGHPDSLTKMLNSPMAILMTSIFVFVAVVWWFVGRIMRWVFYKIWVHTQTSTS